MVMAMYMFRPLPVYTPRPRQHHCVPSQPFGIWPRSDQHCAEACLGFSVFLDSGHGPFGGFSLCTPGSFGRNFLSGFCVLNRPLGPRAFILFVHGLAHFLASAYFLYFGLWHFLLLA